MENYRKVLHWQICASCSIEILSGAKLTAIEQDMADLKVCYELTPVEVEDESHLPSLPLYLWRQSKNVARQLDNIDIRMDDLVTE